MTAIALLYFLKSLQDRRFDLDNGVVMLDDPVSSLDANALYLAFGFIRERAQHAAQLFILTHNFTFFRQVRNWFHRIKGQNSKNVGQRPAQFYMLDCTSDGNGRCSSLRPLDRLLEQFESEYHYLFACVYREAQALTPATLEGHYFLPNMARRLLEAFLAFRQPQVRGELWQKIKGLEFDEAKKLRILRFLHTYSHNDVIGEPVHDPSLLSEARSVLKDLLEFIQCQDPKHFAAMVEVVVLPGDEGGDE
jgi:wobble nucleotide-excising tRNase